MHGRKNSAIAFGITLVTPHRTGDANTHPGKRGAAVCRQNTIQEKNAQVSIHEFDCPRTKMPMPAKPFTPDMFNCEPRPLPNFPPPVMMSPKVERVRKELERSRTASYPSSKKSSLTARAVAWEFFKVVFAGVFLAFKYIFIAVALIITISCMICAGRQTGGLR